MSGQVSIDELIGWDSLLTDDEKEVRRSVRRFVDSQCMPRITDAFEAGRFPEEVVAGIADLGLLGANLHGYGCAGVSSVAYGLACHELEACDSGLRSFVSVQTSLAMYAILTFGSEAQKQRWLPQMAAGKVIGCFGLTEPDHGSDPGSMATYCVKDGDHWLLNGSKMWITNAQSADISVVWARERGGAGRILGFLVEKGTEGFEAVGIPHKLSMKASFTGGLFLNDVRLPESSRMPEGVGLKAPLMCLNNARFGVAFGVVGAARDCLERAVAYSLERKQFGVPLASKQLIQAQLAEMLSDIAKASVLSVHYGRLKDQGKLKPHHVSLLKRNNCKIALDAARTARSILGANGITTDHHVIRHAVNLESTYTYEGTNEIHSLVLGEFLTGIKAY
ncbi:MAG: acyl-CoA dehydrogenase [Deltaproteobacteria bacterium CG2_30_63_29]|nr:MAG: acyl-CoA dehydrogenase [Deltaproteobacteria bacterium CG2_30_63_29]PJB39996.1 MAG: acyl-CoA dehydrogenase [Deltaproteobacteria bacterium CG_4_9_14_3_um_filter_63_12]